MNGGTQALLCRVGTRVCALPLAHVAETMRALPVEPIAGAPPFVLGLSIVRGAPTPVVDAGAIVGCDLPSRPQSRFSRFVTVRVGERRAALAVDDVLGVRVLERLESLPPLLRDLASDAVTSVGTLDSMLLMVLESARLLPDSVWKALEGTPVAR